jgi:hypothetical protein
MDINEKIMKALAQLLKIDYIRLDVDDRISGFVVSPQFVGMSGLDRQMLIDQALDKATDLLSPKERRRVVMIAGLTPVEYDAVGAPIRVQKVRELTGGKVEVLVNGGWSDAEYVRGALNNQKGVKTTEPKQVTGALGALISFQANGTETTPLTKERAVRVLKNDRYIEVLANA